MSALSPAELVPHPDFRPGLTGRPVRHLPAQRRSRPAPHMALQAPLDPHGPVLVYRDAQGALVRPGVFLSLRTPPPLGSRVEVAVHSTRRPGAPLDLVGTVVLHALDGRGQETGCAVLMDPLDPDQARHLATLVEQAGVQPLAWTL